MLRIRDEDALFAEGMPHRFEIVRSQVAQTGLGIVDPQLDLELDRAGAECREPDLRVRILQNASLSESLVVLPSDSDTSCAVILSFAAR